MNAQRRSLLHRHALRSAALVCGIAMMGVCCHTQASQPQAAEEAREEARNIAADAHADGEGVDVGTADEPSARTLSRQVAVVSTAWHAQAGPQPQATAMAWVRRPGSSLAVGVGVQQALPAMRMQASGPSPLAPHADDAQALVGVAWTASARTSLDVSTAASALHAQRDAAMVVGMNLRAAKSAGKALGGLLRLELSSQSALQFKPRKGRVAVAYTRQW